MPSLAVGRMSSPFFIPPCRNAWNAREDASSTILRRSSDPSAITLSPYFRGLHACHKEKVAHYVKESPDLLVRFRSWLGVIVNPSCKACTWRYNNARVAEVGGFK